MRIAIINSIASVGGSRFDRVLLKSLRNLEPDLGISYFTGYEYFDRESTAEELHNLGIDSHKYNPLLLLERKQTLASQLLTINRQNRVTGNFPSFSYHQISNHRLPSHFYNFIRLLLFGARNWRYLYFSLKEFIKFRKGNSPYDTSRFDALVFTWPYSMSIPPLSTPHIAVFHDFNFCNVFGPAPCGRETRQLLLENLKSYIKNGLAVVSTDFMKEEALRFLPEAHERIFRVHVASFAEPSSLTKKEAQRIIQRFNIQGKYIIYPCNQAYHKNIQQLFTAVYLLKQQGHNIRLILVGHLTENVEQGKLSYNSVACDPNEKNWDVKGIGYVSNQEVDALIQCAEVVVSTSLYEAASGPGMDGWAKGTPVAFSNLPFNTEHFQYMKVRARTFDPKNAHDIAKTLSEILNNPEDAQKDARESLHAIMNHYPPQKMAQGYLDVIKLAISQRNPTL